MHHIIKKITTILTLTTMVISSLSSAVTAAGVGAAPAQAKKQLSTCITKKVQGWKLNSNDFSNIEGNISYNGGIILSIPNGSPISSVEGFITEINNSFQKFTQEKGIIAHSFAYDSVGNIIYIVDSENNPLDSKDGIEIVLKNNNDDSYILGDKTLMDNGYGDTEGRIYSYQDISDCTAPKDNSQCTIKTVQGWTINGSDFSNIAVMLSYNGNSIIDNDFKSLNDMIVSLNENFTLYQEKNGGNNYNFIIKDNIIYIIDSDTKLLDNKTEFIELSIYNYNDDTYFIEDKTESDGGFTNGLVYSNQDIKTCTNIPTQCTTKTVQGWILNGSDFSNIEFIGRYNGTDFIKNKGYTSVESIIADMNKAYSEYAIKFNLTNQTFAYNSDMNMIYLVDSDKNPLDNKKDNIELLMTDINTDTYFIEDKAESDGGFTNGLIYSHQDLSICTTPPTDQCTIETTVQGWKLDSTDFSNMEIIIQHNGTYILNKGGYISIEELLAELNKTYSEYAIKSDLDNKEFVYDTETNHIYIKDSNSNRLDAKTTMIEIVLINRNDDSLIIKKSDLDGGNFEGLIYSDIQICNQTTGEETCTPDVVQGWKLNSTDFSNIEFIGRYNGSDFIKDKGYTSIDEVITNINKLYNDYALKYGLTNQTFAYNADANIIYLVDSNKNPLDIKKDSIELRITNADIQITDGLVGYSNQDLANCDSVTPPKPEIDIPDFVCSHKMNGFDIALYSMTGNPSDIYFHGVEDDSTSEGKYVSTPISQINNAEIQVLLNNIYGENKVIRYFNEDDSIVTVRYDSTTIDPKNIYILMGDNKQASNKFNGGDKETTHSLCPKGAPTEPTKMNVESICTPDEVTDKKQKVTCTFIITNKGPSVIHNAHSSGFTPFNGFIITDQGGFSSTDGNWDVEQVEKYTVVGYQTIFPKKGSENIAIGSFNFEYVDPRDGNTYNAGPTVNIKTSTLVIQDTTAPVTPTILTLEGEKNRLYTTHDGTPMITYNKPSINGIGEIGSTIIAQINGNTYSTVVNMKGEWKISIDKALKDNNYIAYITSVDASGNKSKEVNVSFIINTSTGTAPAVIIPIEKAHNINIINTGTNNTGSTVAGGITSSGTTTPTSLGVKSATIIDTIKKESVKETISRTSERATNYCIYEDPMPLNAWQDVTDAEYSSDIKNLIGKCIVNGFDNQMLYFGPNKIIKKAEAVKIIAKWFKLPLSSTTVDSNKRWSIYLKSLQDSKALEGLESTWNEKTMEQGVVGDDVVMILKNINPDSNTNLVDLLKTKKVSRKVFAHVITQQIQ